MKRSLISLSLAALVSANLAAARPASTEDANFDRTLPTYPELGFDSWRNDAGESEADNMVKVQIASNGYSFNAGESTHDLVVQDVGSV
jgi:ABC-type glycerol-3-phosphate transport system substrate-binding protein